MNVELGCAGLWLAFTRVETDLGWTDAVYRVERMADGTWTIRAEFPRLDVETERYGGFPTLRAALRCVDRDRRVPYSLAG